MCLIITCGWWLQCRCSINMESSEQHCILSFPYPCLPQPSPQVWVPSHLVSPPSLSSHWPDAPSCLPSATSFCALCNLWMQILPYPQPFFRMLPSPPCLTWNFAIPLVFSSPLKWMLFSSYSPVSQSQEVGKYIPLLPRTPFLNQCFPHSSSKSPVPLKLHHLDIRSCLMLSINLLVAHSPSLSSWPAGLYFVIFGELHIHVMASPSLPWPPHLQRYFSQSTAAAYCCGHTLNFDPTRSHSKVETLQPQPFP